ncbi:hypothetical protein [Pseudanabaena sp. PCC 6802]|uniref:hypothetical protein n=1 Tax=Pseudanabaena sp. PCC 6802 TaxID=118173 RepID=UPI000344E2D2|nr:hypothetical protein [Pseudanabaena sp. PCC 6802]
MQIRDPWIGEPPPPQRKRIVFTFTALGKEQAEILLTNKMRYLPDLTLPILEFTKII